MTYLTKTFCNSPNCKNDCGRSINELKKYYLHHLDDNLLVSYDYFCGSKEKTKEEENKK